MFSQNCRCIELSLPRRLLLASLRMQYPMFLTLFDFLVFLIALLFCRQGVVQKLKARSAGRFAIQMHYFIDEIDMTEENLTHKLLPSVIYCNKTL